MLLNGWDHPAAVSYETDSWMTLGLLFECHDGLVRVFVEGVKVRNCGCLSN